MIKNGNNLFKVAVKKDYGDIHIFMKKMTKEIVDEIRSIRKDNADFYARMLIKSQRRLKHLEKPML